jgi:transposase
MPDVKLDAPGGPDAGVALPDHPDDLRQYCMQLLAELQHQTQLIEKLTHELALFRRYLYGRRSERLLLDPTQLLLEFTTWLKAQNEAAPLPADATRAPEAPPPASPRPRPGHRRNPLPAFLPRRRVEHTLPDEQCTCRACGARLVKIGEETSEQLDYQPASRLVTEHVRFKYACQACEGHVATSALPAQPIDKGRPGPGLLAQVITAKYADHVPLHRQVDIFARHGVALARQTLCDWVAEGAGLLEPVYHDLKAHVLASKVVQTDDTTVPVQDRARTTTRDGRLWVDVGDTQPATIVYDYTPTRSRAGPSAFLGDFRGYLQADAYAGYDALRHGAGGRGRVLGPCPPVLLGGERGGRRAGAAGARVHPAALRGGDRGEGRRGRGAARPPGDEGSADPRPLPNVA